MDMATEKDIRWIQRLNNYNKALERLTDAVRIISAEGRSTEDVDELLKEGLIQRFEYTQELAWKVMKDYEEYQGHTDVTGSRDAFRKALQIGLIHDAEWMNTIASRNITSHCYDEEEFNQVIAQIIHKYLPIFLQFQDKMNKLRATES